METRGGSEKLEGLRYLGTVGPLPVPGSDPGRSCAIAVFAPKMLEGEGEWHALVGWCRALAWEGVADEVGEAVCSVLLVPELPDEDLGEGLRREMRENRPLPWIVLTRCVPGNVDRVDAWKGVGGVVWLEEAHETLAATVLQLLEQDPSERMARVLETSGWLPGQLRTCLARVCRARPPPKTVAGLCRVVGLKESHLRYAWMRHLPPRISPAELVDHLILAEALRLRRVEGSWVRVAARLGITESTLRAKSRRRTGLTLGELARRGRGFMWERMREWLTVERGG